MDPDALVQVGTDAATQQWDQSVSKGDTSPSAATQAISKGLNAAATYGGAAVATAACAATGVGAVIAPLCGLAGGFIGQKLVGPLVHGIEQVGKAIGHFFSNLFSNPPPPPILIGTADQTTTSARAYEANQITAMVAGLILMAAGDLLDAVNQLVALHDSLGVPEDAVSGGHPLPYTFTYCMSRLHFDQGLAIDPAHYAPGTFDSRIEVLGIDGTYTTAVAPPYGYIDWPSPYGPPRWQMTLGQWIAASKGGTNDTLADLCGLPPSAFAPVGASTPQSERLSLLTGAQSWFKAIVPGGSGNLYSVVGNLPAEQSSYMAQMARAVAQWRMQATQAVAREAIALSIAGALHQAVGSQAVATALKAPPAPPSCPIVAGMQFFTHL